MCASTRRAQPPLSFLSAGWAQTNIRSELPSRKAPTTPRSASDLPVQPLNGVVGSDLNPMHRREVTVGQGFLDPTFYLPCSDDSVQRIADEVAMDAKSVRKYIAIGTLNERRVDFYRQYDEGGEETGEDVTVDTTSQPDKLYFQAVLYDALHRAYDNLTYREQRTVAKHLGFCGICWSVKKAVLINGEIEYRPIKPMTFGEISHSASRRSDKASERTYKNALEKMRKAFCVK